MEEELRQLREELAQAQGKIAQLQIRTVTTLSGIDFITLVVIVPMVAAFVVLGMIIVWKTTSNPAAVAPHLDIILVAFAIFSNPVTAAVTAIMTRYGAQRKDSDGGGSNVPS